MRTMLIAAALLLLVAASATAQTGLPAPAYQLEQVAAPAGAQAPGSTAEFNFTATRTCSNQADYLEATMAKVDFLTSDNLTVAGPGQIQFPAQMCAQQSVSVVPFKASIAVPDAAESRVYKVRAMLSPNPSGPMPRAGNEAALDFLFAVRAPDAKPAPAAEEVKGSPGAAPMFLFAALAMAALVARRGT